MKKNFECWNCHILYREYALKKSRTITCINCGATTVPHAEGIEPSYSWNSLSLSKLVCTDTSCWKRESL